MRDPRSIVIDYGGTWIRIAAINRKGRILRRLKKESFPLKNLPSFLRDLYRKWKIRNPEHLVIGARGVWKKSKKNRLYSQLKTFAEKVRVLSDVELAHRSVFRGSPGILLIAGTGSIAYGIDDSGHFARAGGLGPKKGDEGSGYWIGKKYLELSKRKGEKTMSVRQIASLAPLVIRKAERGNLHALGIVREAYEHLAEITIQCASKLRLKKKNVLCLSGGLFQNRFFKNGFIRYLTKKTNLFTVAAAVRFILPVDLKWDCPMLAEIQQHRDNQRDSFFQKS